MRVVAAVLALAAPAAAGVASLPVSAHLGAVRAYCRAVGDYGADAASFRRAAAALRVQVGRDPSLAGSLREALVGAAEDAGGRLPRSADRRSVRLADVKPSMAVALHGLAALDDAVIRGGRPSALPAVVSEAVAALREAGRLDEAELRMDAVFEEVSADFSARDPGPEPVPDSGRGTAHPAAGLHAPSGPLDIRVGRLPAQPPSGQRAASPQLGALAEIQPDGSVRITEASGGGHVIHAYGDPTAYVEFDLTGRNLTLQRANGLVDVYVKDGSAWKTHITGARPVAGYVRLIGFEATAGTPGLFTFSGGRWIHTTRASRVGASLSVAGGTYDVVDGVWNDGSTGGREKRLYVEHRADGAHDVFERNPDGSRTPVLWGARPVEGEATVIAADPAGMHWLFAFRAGEWKSVEGGRFQGPDRFVLDGGAAYARRDRHWVPDGP